MPEAHAHALQKGSRIEEYEIVRVLGEGGFGITYLAFDDKLNGPVALKEYFPTSIATRTDDRRVVASSTENHETFAWGLDRFIEEARTVRRFRHPNVVTVHHFVEAHGTAYIVMEYVDGESLDVFLESHRSLSVREWRPWLDRLLDALMHVHSHGYLHRDIKPGNIVLRAADGEPVLIDFGSARVAARDRTHTRVLTPVYAPIEQHSSRAAQGPWTDIYALAAVSYRALTTAPPPEAPDRILDDRYKPLAWCGDGATWEWLKEIDHGLALRPEDRPQTTRSWRAALREAGQAGQAALGSAEVSRLRKAAAGGNLQALQQLRQAADHGDVDAQCTLGLMHKLSEGVLRDDAQVVAWYGKAAARGYPHAQFTFGTMHYNGDRVPQDYVQAAAWYRRAADQGVESAQCSLGEMYARGHGVTANDAHAVAWYRRAADQRYAPAYVPLGRMYAGGKGVPRDDAQAVEYYRRAAELGDADAQFALGQMYHWGRSVQFDTEEAAVWWRRAAEQDHAKAQLCLGRLFSTWLYDPDQAEAWCHKAADQGDAAGQFALGQLSSSSDRAVEWYRKAADQGHARAQLALGRAYEQGKGVPRDDEQAMKWYRQAADQNDKVAARALGRLLLATDRQRALTWYRKAADQGDAVAGFILADEKGKQDQFECPSLQDPAQYIPHGGLPIGTLADHEEYEFFVKEYYLSLDHEWYFNLDDDEEGLLAAIFGLYVEFKDDGLASGLFESVFDEFYDADDVFGLPGDLRELDDLEHELRDAVSTHLIHGIEHCGENRYEVLLSCRGFDETLSECRDALEDRRNGSDAGNVECLVEEVERLVEELETSTRSVSQQLRACSSWLDKWERDRYAIDIFVRYVRRLSRLQEARFKTMTEEVEKQIAELRRAVEDLRE